MSPGTLILALTLSHLGLNGQSTATIVPTVQPDSLFVSADWLADRLEDRGLVLLHVGPSGDYDAGHIPGARYVSLSKISD